MRVDHRSGEQGLMKLRAEGKWYRDEMRERALVPSPRGMASHPHGRLDPLAGGLRVADTLLPLGR